MNIIQFFNSGMTKSRECLTETIVTFHLKSCISYL